MTVADDRSKEMNNGVALLLERMKTNPEEFVIEEGVVGKWDSLVRSYEGVLPPEDVKEYKQALNTLLQQQFTEKVLEELVDPKKSERYVEYETINLNGMPLGGVTRTLSTLKAIGVSNATITTNTAGGKNLLKTIFGSSK